MWELELTPHVERRMDDRDFTEIDLRSMLDVASAYRSDILTGRFVIVTRHNGRPWDVVVEPDRTDRLLVVVTAYPVDP